MMRGAIWAAAVCAVLGASGADEVVTPERDEVLFNGRDFTNFYVYVGKYGKNRDPNGTFTVTNGVMHVSGRDFGCITTEKAYSNYVFSLEYRWTGEAHGDKLRRREAPDSGILFHSNGKDGVIGPDNCWMYSHEYNLLLGASGDFWTVGPDDDPAYQLTCEVDERLHDNAYYIWRRGGKKVTLIGNQRVCRFDIAPDHRNRADAKPSQNERPMGEWNRAALVCAGDTVKCYFNGLLVNEARHVRPCSGKIQLQSEGCGVEFRNVRIAPATQENAAAAALGSPLAVRGVKAMLPAREAFGDFRRLIDLMARYGLNTLMLELGGAMEYRSHPEVNEGWADYAKFINEYPGKSMKIQHSFKWHKNSIHSENGGGGVLTQKEIAELAGYARARGIEIIPEVPCLSHSDYLLWRHRDLAERADDPYPDCYCPSNPRSYALLFDLLDEVVALFRPRIVNIGHDEWYSIGICDKCRGKDAARLYADDVGKIRGHLAAKGVRTMMWAEKLLDFRFCDSKQPWGGAGRPDVPATWRAVDMLPKDVLLLHWYWSLGRKLEDEFVSRGYDWVFGNYSARSMIEYPARSRKPGFGGYMLSNWGRTDLPTLQRNGVLADLVMNKLVAESPDPDAEIDALWGRMFRELFLLRHPAGKNWCFIRHFAAEKRPFKAFFDGDYLKPDDWLLGEYRLTLADGRTVAEKIHYGGNVLHRNPDWNPPREHDTDARAGRGELAGVAYSTLPVRLGEHTEYVIAVELPAGAKVAKCEFAPAARQKPDAVAWRLVERPADL